MTWSSGEESGMPIKIMLTERGAAPMIVCDICGIWIQRADVGGYAWSEQRTELGSLHDVAFVHKGDCFLTYESRQGTATMDMPLEVLLPYLAASLEVNWEAATNLAEYFSTQ
jgi:hypothetical protein